MARRGGATSRSGLHVFLFELCNLKAWVLETMLEDSRWPLERKPVLLMARGLSYASPLDPSEKTLRAEGVRFLRGVGEQSESSSLKTRDFERVGGFTESRVYLVARGHRHHQRWCGEFFLLPLLNNVCLQPATLKKRTNTPTRSSRVMYTWRLFLYHKNKVQ